MLEKVFIFWQNTLFLTLSSAPYSGCLQAVISVLLEPHFFIFFLRATLAAVLQALPLTVFILG